MSTKVEFKKDQKVTDKFGKTGVVARGSYLNEEHGHNHVDVLRDDDICGDGVKGSFIYDEKSLVYDEKDKKK
jgi:hypothetical protein